MKFWEASSVKTGLSDVQGKIKFMHKVNGRKSSTVKHARF